MLWRPLHLEMTELARRRLQAAAGQAPDLHTALRVSKSALRTAGFQEDVVTQARCPLLIGAPEPCISLHAHKY